MIHKRGFQRTKKTNVDFRDKNVEIGGFPNTGKERVDTNVEIRGFQSERGNQRFSEIVFWPKFGLDFGVLRCCQTSRSGDQEWEQDLEQGNCETAQVENPGVVQNACQPIRATDPGQKVSGQSVGPPVSQSVSPVQPV